MLGIHLFYWNYLIEPDYLIATPILLLITALLPSAGYLYAYSISQILPQRLQHLLLNSPGPSVLRCWHPKHCGVCLCASRSCVVSAYVFYYPRHGITLALS